MDIQKNCPLCGGAGLWNGWDGLGYAGTCPCMWTPSPGTEEGYKIVLESPELQDDRHLMPNR